MFTATYLLLSIEVGNKPIFQSIYKVTAPLTTAAQKYIAGLVGSGISGTRTVGEKLFQNSSPRSGAALGPKKRRSPSAPQENIPEAERRELNDLIKGYSN